MISMIFSNSEGRGRIGTYKKRKKENMTVFTLMNDECNKELIYFPGNLSCNEKDNFATLHTHV